MDKTHKLVLTSLFFAIAIILSIIENSLPPLPIAVPGVKFGLSNIAVMYVLFFIGKESAYMVAVLKAVFVFATRGWIASVLSLTGGILSLTIMILLMVLFREKISYLILSIAGAVFHNIGQLIAVSIVYTNLYLMYFMPVLLVTGVLAGVVTSVLLNVIRPAFKRVGFSNKN
jgi:heptaprenyl diphosphate synthase